MLLLLLLMARVILGISITGAGGSGSNSINTPQPFRYEISNFSQSGPAWDLFIQALGAIQSRDQVRSCIRTLTRTAADRLQSDPMSYFQIAGTMHPAATTQLLTFKGIHGYPQTPWDGVDGAGSFGYCMHSCVLFPSWHRPFVALYEVIRFFITHDLALLTKFLASDLGSCTNNCWLVSRQ